MHFLITPLLTKLAFQLFKSEKNHLIYLTIINNGEVLTRLGNNQYMAVHLWKNVALSGISGPVDHFRSHPYRLSFGLRNQSETNITLLTQWKIFVMWFSEFVRLGSSLLVFPTPLLTKYSLLMTLGSSTISIHNWSILTELTQVNVQRHSKIFRYFARYASDWQSHLCVFPDIISQHATVSNINRNSIATLGLVPLSHLSFKLTFSLHVFDLSLNVQLLFLNLLRYLYNF